MEKAYGSGRQKPRASKGIRRFLWMASACAILLCGCAKERQTGQDVQSKENAKKQQTRIDAQSKEKQEQGAQSLEGQGQGAGSREKRETVSLTVWGAKEDTQLMAQVLQGFRDAYRDQADFQITYQAQGETGCKDALLGNLEEGADVFAFADDQLHALAAAGALEPIEDADAIRAKHLERAVEAACVGDTVYAYPLTADNGYFLYYNKEFFTQEDIRSLDKMLEIAADNGKYVAMDWSSAWYVYAFFGNTGMEVGLKEDGITNFCRWNRKDGAVNGVDVARAMLAVANNPGFSNRTDTEFMQGVQDGTAIAGISGVWNAVAIEEVWGENMGAAKLPTYTCAGRQIQMASFCGCKLIGVNAYSKHPAWATKLAEWITSEKNQQLRFALRGQGPSDKTAAASAQVQESPAMIALLEQSEYAQLQRVGGNFWEPVETFAGSMALGNPTGEDLQEQLDQMVAKVTAR